VVAPVRHPTAFAFPLRIPGAGSELRIRAYLKGTWLPRSHLRGLRQRAHLLCRVDLLVGNASRVFKRFLKHWQLVSDDKAASVDRRFSKRGPVWKPRNAISLRA